MSGVLDLYQVDQIRACEQRAVKVAHLNEDELMLRAGSEAFLLIQRLYPKVQRLAVFCGAGNNAGDGYVLARLAHESGYSVKIVQCKSSENLPAAARQAALSASVAGVSCQFADEPLDIEIDLIIDALLGIGLQGPVQGLIATAIQHINASDVPVVSLDIPSGLNANTGLVENFCVQANETLTFIASKTGLYTADGPDYCGSIYTISLGIEDIVAGLKPKACLLTPPQLTYPRPRKKNSHKGSYGHVLVIGGGPGMPGAASLVAKAALRVGAGSVSIATWHEHASAFSSFLPEAMVWGIERAEELTELLDRASVCAIGPGLGESGWAKSLFLTAIAAQLPMVIDASALKLLAEHAQVDDNWILTPHPGEAAALLSCSVSEVQADRYKTVAQLQRQYGGVVLLKGTGTLIQTESGPTYVCPKGNPGMASAGMGDVLTGVIAGLCAQHLPLAEAAKLGVWLHALAGDRLAQQLGEIGILASELMDVLPEILNGSHEI